MQRLQGMKDRFDIAFACDTDHDRHGIVTPTFGLMPPNHYLTVAIDYLFRNRNSWSEHAGIGKTVVSTSLIDRVSTRLGRKLFEVPVGFKWFSAGLLDGSLGFGGEESAGASFLRRDGKVWTTDKDGLVPALLAAEITARCGQDPAQVYAELVQQLGEPVADRVEAPANAAQKKQLAALKSADITAHELAGETITAVLDRAPGNNAAIGGINIRDAPVGYDWPSFIAMDQPKHSAQRKTVSPMFTPTPVSYTHLRAQRDRTRSRMPSSA